MGAFFAQFLIEQACQLDGLTMSASIPSIRRDYPSVVLANLYIRTLIGLVVNLISNLTYTWIITHQN